MPRAPAFSGDRTQVDDILAPLTRILNTRNLKEVSINEPGHVWLEIADQGYRRERPLRDLAIWLFLIDEVTFSVPLARAAGARVSTIGSCDCEGLRVELDFVCGLEQVLPDRRRRQLGVNFVQTEVPGAM